MWLLQVLMKWKVLYLLRVPVLDAVDDGVDQQAASLAATVEIGGAGRS